MQQLLRNFAPGQMAHTAPPRFLGIGFAGLLTASFIVALSLGLTYKIKITPPVVTDVTFVSPEPPKTDAPPTPKTFTTGPIDIPNPKVEFPPDDLSLHPINGTTDTDGLVQAAGIASTHTTPVYPLQSRALGEKGMVRLLITVAENGRVSEAQVLQSSGYPRLDAAAVSWVTAHWRYRPAMQNGKPIAVKTQATIAFRLK